MIKYWIKLLLFRVEIHTAHKINKAKNENLIGKTQYRFRFHPRVIPTLLLIVICFIPNTIWYGLSNLKELWDDGWRIQSYSSMEIISENRPTKRHMYDKF